MTDIIFLLDRSGSMKICEDDAIGGYNSFLDIQKQENSEAYITTILFDNNYEILHDHVDIQEVNYITKKEYFARGTTALLDAIGTTINRVSSANAIMIIITDGLDNASKKFQIKDIYAMIDEKQKQNWEFIFLGANIDAIKTAGSIGITSDRAADFPIENLRNKFEGLARTVTSFRTSGIIGEEWK
ncbi:MAG: VWA domain-containing protein [Synergistaceae bacterium]|nr:VWA domain-containing protein [Synergistaceae bacterium]